MHATIRRYDGVDQNRTVELTGKVNETLIPKLSKLDGFKGYYLIEAGNGIFSSIGLFETPEQGEASSKLASSWVRDEKLETAFPNFKHTITRCIESGDTVACEGKFTGDNTGPMAMPGAMPNTTAVATEHSSAQGDRSGGFYYFWTSVPWTLTTRPLDRFRIYELR